MVETEIKGETPPLIEAAVNLDWMQEAFQPPVDAEERARGSIRGNSLRVADSRIPPLIEMAKVLMVKFYKYGDGVGLDADLCEILNGLADPSKLLPDFSIVIGLGALTASNWRY